MAEKITLFELDLDIDAVLKSTEETKRKMLELSDAQKELRKTGQQASKEFIQNDANLKNLRQEYNQNVKVIQAHNQQSKSQINVIKKTDGSIKQLSRAINLNEKAYDSLTKKQREGTQGQELKKTIQDQREEYKGLKGDIGNTSVFVGDYDGRIQNLTGNLRIMGVNVGRVITNLKAKRDGLKATATATRAMGTATSGTSRALKLFRIALIATGIGAIVVALGTLISAFASTQKGADAISRALAPIKGAFQGIIGVIQKIATNVFGTLGDRFTLVKNGILQGIDLIRLGWNKLTGDMEEVEEIEARMEKRRNESIQAQIRLNQASSELGEIFAGAGEEIQKAAEAQKQIVELGIQIEKQDNNLIVTKAKLLDQIKAQEEIAKNTTLTDAERLKAIEEAEKLTKRLAQEETNILKLKIEQKKLEQSQNDTSREEIKELRELEAQLISKETERRAIDLKFQGSRNSIINKRRADEEKAHKERIARAKKEVDNAIKDSKTKLNLFIEEFQAETAGLNDSVKFAEQIKDKKLDILKQEFKAKKLTESEFELESLRIKKEFLGKQAELTTQFAEQNIDASIQDLELFKANNTSKLDSTKALTQELINEEQTRLNSIQEQRLTILQQQRENELISEQEFNLQKIQLDQEFENQKAELQNQLKLQQAEKRQIDFDNDIETRRLQGDSEFELQLLQLDRKRQAELDNAEKTGADKVAIVSKFAEKEKQINQLKEQANLQITSDILGQASSLLKEGSIEAKALGIAQATVNTYLGATKALATLPPPAGAIVAGLTTAQGLASVAKIVGVKLATGGQVPLLSGQRINYEQNIPTQSNGDNVLATVKRGEVVLNEQQQRALGGYSTFSSIGVPGFAVGGSIGSTVVNNSITNNNNNDILEIIKEFQPIVRVEDILSETGKSIEVQDNANI